MKRLKIWVLSFIVILSAFFTGYTIVELLVGGNRNEVPNQEGTGDFPRSEMPIEIGFALLVGLIFFGGCWMIHKFKQKRTRNKPILVMSLLLMLLLPTVLFPKALAHVDTVIDVIGVGDEEFNAICPEGWERYSEWEIYIYDAFGAFREVFGLDFQLRGWIYFNSNNSVFSIAERLKEAELKTGFKSKWTRINGYFIDVLLVFTAQLTLDYDGYAFADRNTAILFWSPSRPRTQLVMHELTHLFWLGHCNNYCVMKDSTTPGEIMPRQWCDAHIKELNSNGYKNKFDMVSPDINHDGKVDMRDIAIVTKAYGTYPGQVGWNPDADMNLDGKIDMRDIAYVSKYYGIIL